MKAIDKRENSWILETSTEYLSYFSCILAQYPGSCDPNTVVILCEENIAIPAWQELRLRISAIEFGKLEATTEFDPKTVLEFLKEAFYTTEPLDTERLAELCGVNSNFTIWTELISGYAVIRYEANQSTINLGKEVPELQIESQMIPIFRVKIENLD